MSDGTEYTSDESVNPAVQYLRHDLQLADVALNVTVPDADELYASSRYGHFADHLAHEHVAAEDAIPWDYIRPGDDSDTPSDEAQAMHKL